MAPGGAWDSCALSVERTLAEDVGRGPRVTILRTRMVNTVCEHRYMLQWSLFTPTFCTSRRARAQAVER